tara:strand:- start:257 stop:439 length:183 start_codon:yes stop_codon:yes gene_type:complete
MFILTLSLLAWLSSATHSHHTVLGLRLPHIELVIEAKHPLEQKLARAALGCAVLEAVVAA